MLKTFKIPKNFCHFSELTFKLTCGRNPGSHWKRRGHRGEEEDMEEDMTKDLDESSAGASMEEGSMSKNGMYCSRNCSWSLNVKM